MAVQVKTAASLGGKVQRISGLTQEYAGKYYVESRLLMAITHFAQIFIAIEDDNVIGALTVSFPTVPEIIQFNHHLPRDEQLDPLIPTAELCDMVVHGEYRRQGIARSLVWAAQSTLWYRAAIPELLRQYSCIITMSRVPQDGSWPTSRGCLIRRGFRKVASVPRYYSNLTEDEFRCPACCEDDQYAPCHCDGLAMVWRRDAHD
jgi:ribosomal protein S18 acetylase RimI-like enzyme